MKILLTSLICFLFAACTIEVPVTKPTCDPATCKDPTCKAYKPGTLQDQIDEAIKKQAEETKKMIEEEGYSIIPPTATEAIRQLGEVTSQQLLEYFPCTVEKWGYISQNHKQEFQRLELNLPKLCPDLNTQGITVGIGNPLVRKVLQTRNSRQYVIFCVEAPLYLKTGIMAIRIYGNALGPFEPEMLVIVRRFEGEARDFYWQYQDKIPVLIPSDVGHQIVERWVRIETEKWKSL